MSTEQNHVTVMAKLLGLRIDDARAERVAAHFARTKLLAELLGSVPLSPFKEPAEIYQPAPFPTEVTSS